MKWILGASLFTCAALSMHSHEDLGSRYHRVESYEMRPGILATPNYTSDGALCEISIEKRHVTGDAVDLGSTMPRELAQHMIDELAPPSERGKATMTLAGHDYIDSISGPIVVTLGDYENVSVQIFRSRSDSGDRAVILRWKKHC